MAASVRDSLRSKLLGTHKFQTRLVELVDGIHVEFRQPSVEDIMNMPSGDEGKQDVLTHLIINYSYVPDTNEKVFEDGDKAVISSWPVGPWINNLNTAIEELTSLEIDSSVKN